jgi:uncharacterized small protein (DUF1192 family)
MVGLGNGKSLQAGIAGAKLSAVFTSSGSTLMDLDEMRPVKKLDIVIGEDLALMSLAELEHRVHLLESEIARIRETIAGKQSSKAAADAFFRN